MRVAQKNNFQITLGLCSVVTNDNLNVYIKFQIILTNIEDSPQIHTFTIVNEWRNLYELLSCHFFLFKKPE